MAQYNENVIQQFVDDLCRRATFIVVDITARWLFASLAIGFIGSRLFLAWQPQADVPVGLISAGFAIVGMTIGIMKGRARAFALRLQAQQVLLQMQIERNTRPKTNC